ncbi:hypothetical protein GCK72_000800 [Caenorhabditis remanei]|uniref:Uncharacterized protein n=1 Tax=Caenorhabditis remanei TaxID=31234 RepID=A0A6A5HRL8_CAERE|nr:hypothetical protein GCK72_000800 [Caenorhabditis remanei]KAF1768987.1 hypothetical protein GCK72_000800 [Caenorhabditis remanei]
MELRLFFFSTPPPFRTFSSSADGEFTSAISTTYELCRCGFTFSFRDVKIPILSFVVPVGVYGGLNSDVEAIVFVSERIEERAVEHRSNKSKLEQIDSRGLH